ncbi:MAG: lysylphosphatidylglycerol synthase transmembrane domain-containing protein [Acetobacterales bacterium]
MAPWLTPLLKALVSAVLIAWLLSAIDADAALRWLRRLAPVAAVLAVAVFYLQGLVFVVRWRWLLASVGMGRPVGAVLQIVWIGLFFNQVLPSSVGGDAVRVWYLRQSGTTLSDAFLGVMAERVIQVVGLLLLIVCGMPSLLALMPDHALAVALPAAMLGLLAAIGGLLWFDRLPLGGLDWPLLATLCRLAAMLRGLCASPATAVLLLALSVAGHVLLVVAVWLLALGLDLSLSFGEALVIVPLAMFVTLVPVSIAGWGVREGALAAGFGLIGIPLEAAVVVSVLFGLAAVLQGLPGGVLWVLARGRRPPLKTQSLTIEGSE